VVLDGVVGPAGQHLGHVSPLISHGGVRQKQNPLLTGRPLSLEYTRIEMVVPSLPTLLPEPAGHELSDERPALCPVLLDQPSHEVVLLVAPRLLFQEFGLVGLFLVRRLLERQV
jgi:hypothetical protein